MRVFSTSSTLNPGASVVSVANPGKNLEDLQVDDLSLQKLKSSKLSAFFKQSARDSCVLDSFHFVSLRVRRPFYGVLDSDFWAGPSRSSHRDTLNVVTCTSTQVSLSRCTV